MDLDDEQLLRHTTREMGKFLSIVYHELRGVGLPKKLAIDITVSHYNDLRAAQAVAEITQAMMDKIEPQEGNGSD